MTEACYAAESATASRCPACGNRSAGVDLLTVKALLTPVALRRVGAGPFRFCGNPACGVYFSAEQQYLTSDVRVQVWQKAPPGRRMICYCFGEDEAGMLREIEYFESFIYLPAANALVQGLGR